jgi:predicted RNA-binding Zn ribbon-like protein
MCQPTSWWAIAARVARCEAVVSSEWEASEVVQSVADERAFDLTGGALGLDFANTLDDRPDPRPIEGLESYGDLLAFARQSTALPESLLDTLWSEAARRPAEAERALAAALGLREVIYRIFLALSEGRQALSDDLTALNRALGAALAHARVVEADDRFAWDWAREPVDLEAPLWPVARSAAELLTSATLASLRLCAADACAWLFLDTSRNGSRRWCSMRTCGNRAKARRHHARVRAAATSPGAS